MSSSRSLSLSSLSGLSRASGALAAGIVLAGIGVGAVAHLGSEGQSARIPGLPPSLVYVPSSASLVGYIDLRALASSPLSETWSREVENQRRFGALQEFRESTGIDLLEEVDALTFSVPSKGDKPGNERWGIAATGAFDFRDLVGKLSEHQGGVEKETHAGTTLYLVKNAGQAAEAGSQTVAIAHPNESTLLIGQPDYVREMIDSASGGKAPAPSLLEGFGYGGFVGETFWIAGTPPKVVESMVGRGDREPALRSFAVTGRLDSDVSLKARGRAIDPQSAQKLADVVRGFVALGRLREGSSPEVSEIAEAVQIDQVEEEVEVSLVISYDTIQKLLESQRKEAASP